MYRKTLYHCLSLVLLLSGCRHYPAAPNFTSQYQDVLAHFKNDPAKYVAAQFLVANLSVHYTIKTRFISDDKVDYTRFLSTYAGTLTSKGVQDSLHVTKIVTDLYDSAQVSPDYLIRSIDEAFDLYKKTFVRLHYGLDTFFNYLLPYRVGYEELNPWRRYMWARYSRFLSTYDLTNMPVYDLTKLIDAEQTGTSAYSLNRLKNVTQPSVDQTVGEIVNVRVPFSCEDYCIRAIYTYRALGIPAAYETAPLLGKFNYGHAQAAYLSESGVFLPNGDDPQHFKYQIAKMYRRTFARQKNPFEAIKRCGEAEKDIPRYFDMPDFIDITRERTDVSDIAVKLEKNERHHVVYLCVYNCGEWHPVEWGNIDMAGKTVFKDMGRKILYHCAYADGGDLFLTGNAFLLDTLGHVGQLNPHGGQLTQHGGSCSLLLFNSDRHEPITPGNNYTLFYWDNTIHAWKKRATQIATRRSLSFSDVPSGVLYKLSENPLPSDREPVRPFTYEDHLQKWW
jgi:hypothetical protein